jgi:beta-glucosidase
MKFLFLILFSLLIPALPNSAFAKVLSFPANFKWCVATAAHQIEGDNTNSDWWAFEKNPGAIKNNEKSGKASDHWNRIEEDTQLMKDLNVKSYRFSIEWAKIEPQEGQWNQAAIDHYKNEIKTLRAQGIEPMITLHHFTFPNWVVAKGSWEWTEFPTAFKKYTEKVVTEIATDVQDWVTFNEPMVVIFGGYMAGVMPPKRNDSKAAGRALTAMLQAHVQSYNLIHAQNKKTKVRVGFAHHLRVFEPMQRFNPIDWLLAKQLDKAWNWAFATAPETGRLQLYVPFLISVDQEIEGLKGTQDFFGVNYYTRDHIHFSLTKFELERSVPAGALVNDLKWEIYSEGFYLILKEISKRFPSKDILVTENGIADHRDAFRKDFLASHFRAMHRAIAEGARVQAYCHWSLLDNFEWNEGFAPRFGLYEVNYTDQKRTPRGSALYFSEVAKKNSFEGER